MLEATLVPLATGASFAFALLFAVLLRSPSLTRQRMLLACAVLSAGILLPGTMYLSDFADATWVWLPLAGMLSILLVLLGGVPYITANITHHWLKSLPIALAALAGHLVLGWPQLYAPDFAQALQSAVLQARQHEEAADSARGVLKEYGLRLPPGYRIIHTQSGGVEASFYYPQNRIDLACRKSAPEREAELRAWLLKSGYRELQRKDAGPGSQPVYVKEPYVADLIGQTQQGSQTCSELLLSKDESGQYLSRWFEGWRLPEGAETSTKGSRAD